MEELLRIISVVRFSARPGSTEVFIQPEEVGVESEVFGPSQSEGLLREASNILKARRREVVAVQSFSPRGERFTEDVLQLDFSEIVKMLRPGELMKEVRNGRTDSVRQLTLAVRDLFSDLSMSFGDSPTAKEALYDLSREFEYLNPEDPSFQRKLNGIVERLASVLALRNSYLRNAREGGFEAEFLSRIRGGETSVD